MQRTFYYAGKLLACLILFAAFGLPSNARPRISADMMEQGGVQFAVITVNDEIAAVIRRPAGGVSPIDRARAYAQRLEYLAGDGIAAHQVHAGRMADGAWSVSIGPTIAVVVSLDDAKASGTSAEKLAKSTAARLGKLIAQPILVPSATHYRLQPGDTRSFTVHGAAYANDISISTDSIGVVTAVYDPSTRTVTLRSLKPGRASLVIQSGGENPGSTAVPVVVLKYAGTIGDAFSVNVTGVPQASREILRDAYTAALAQLVTAEPGAKITVTPIPRFFFSLRPGEKVILTQTIRISGVDMMPVQKKAVITITNRPASSQLPGWLLYSNKPEQVSRGQILFQGRLEESLPWRLIFHHQNVSGRPLLFHIDIKNPSDRQVDIQVTRGIAMPSMDTVQVGRWAGAAFLHAMERGDGIIRDIPPHSQTTVLAQRFANTLTVSGIVQITQLTGPAGSLTVQASAESANKCAVHPLEGMPSYLASTCQLALPDAPLDTDSPADIAASPYVFSSPRIVVTDTYTVDGMWSYVHLGNRDSLTNTAGDRRLFGNYGVDYEIRLTMVNPSEARRVVGIYFDPEAGSAAGVFQIGRGKIMDFDPLDPPEERRLARIVLAPGQKREATIRTIPLNGSSYPVSVIVHAL